MSRLYGPGDTERVDDEDELEDDDELDDEDLDDDDDDDDEDLEDHRTRSDEPACSVCGCTEAHACEGGCIWARSNPWVCSRCAVKA